MSYNNYYLNLKQNHTPISIIYCVTECYFNIWCLKKIASSPLSQPKSKQAWKSTSEQGLQ